MLNQNVIIAMYEQTILYIWFTMCVVLMNIVKQQLLKNYYSHMKIKFATTTQQIKLTMVITNNVECNSSE